VFYGEDLLRAGGGRDEPQYYVCPCCRDEEFSEAVECHQCGKYTPDFDMDAEYDMCIPCADIMCQEEELWRQQAEADNDR